MPADEIRSGSKSAFSDSGFESRPGLESFASADELSESDEEWIEPYVSGLLEFAQADSTQTPITISIEGVADSRRSSFVRLLEQHLASERAVTVWFTPWRHDTEAISEVFVLSLLEQVSAQLRFRTRLLSWMRLAPARLDWRKARSDLIRVLVIGTLVAIFAVSFPQFIAEVGPAIIETTTGIEIDPPLLSGIGTLAMVGILIALGAWINERVYDPVARRVDDYLMNPTSFGRISFIDRLYEDLGGILTSYAGGDRLYVFIDSLEECEPETTIETIELLQRMLSESIPVVFIVSMDRERVMTTVEAMDSDAITSMNSSESGSSWIDSAISVSLRVPSPDPNSLRDQTVRDLRSGLTGIEDVSLNQTQRETVLEMVEPILKGRPYLIREFIDSLRLRILMTREVELLEWSLSIYHLAKFTVIDCRWPSLADELEDDPGALPRLEQAALGIHPKDSVMNQVTLEDDDAELLWNLLRFGIVDEPVPETGMFENAFSFQNADIDIEALLEFS